MQSFGSLCYNYCALSIKRENDKTGEVAIFIHIGTYKQLLLLSDVYTYVHMHKTYVVSMLYNKTDHALQNLHCTIIYDVPFPGIKFSPYIL